MTLFIFPLQLCGWVKNVGEDFLDHNTVMGDSVKTSQDFLYSHQEFDSDRQVRYQICVFNDKPVHFLLVGWVGVGRADVTDVFF